MTNPGFANLDLVANHAAAAKDRTMDSWTGNIKEGEKEVSHSDAPHMQKKGAEEWHQKKA